jgi:hypothetical protein
MAAEDAEQLLSAVTGEAKPDHESKSQQCDLHEKPPRLTRK